MSRRVGGVVRDVAAGVDADAVERFAADLYDALAYPFESWGGTAALLAVSTATYAVLIMSTMPEFSLQMLADGLHRLEYVVVSLSELTYHSEGPAGLGIIVLYAWLTGVAVVNAAAGLGVGSSSGVANVSGIVPALLASGCASCGAGLLAFVGAAGGLALLPFEGAALRLAGLALMVGLLGRAGHPERCRVDVGSRS